MRTFPRGIAEAGAREVGARATAFAEALALVLSRGEYCCAPNRGDRIRREVVKGGEQPHWPSQHEGQAMTA